MPITRPPYSPEFRTPWPTSLLERVRTIHANPHETYGSPVSMPSCGQKGRSMAASGSHA